jgi:uncharacterized protein YbaR (Trm112 family)
MHKSLLSLLQCPLCRSNTLDVDVAEELNGQIYRGQIQCHMCNATFPIFEGIPLLVNAALQKEVLAKWDVSSEYLEYNLESTNRVKALVEKYSKDTDIALDAGCGSGAYTSIFKSKEIICLDLVPFFLKKLLNEYQGSSTLHVLVGDVRQLPFKKQSVDMVLCSNVLEHLMKDEVTDVANHFVSMSRRTVLVDIPNDTGKLVSTIRHTLERLGFYRARSEIISDEKLKHHSHFGVDDLKLIGFAVHGCIGWVSTKYINLGSLWGLYDSIAWSFPRFGSTLIGIKEISSCNMK